METAHLIKQAAKCRRLAASADDKDASQILIALAEEFEQLAAEQLAGEARGRKKSSSGAASLAGALAAARPRQQRRPFS